MVDETSHTWNNDDENQCKICWDNIPTYMPFIKCAHARSFCESCIKGWLDNRHRHCAICRQRWSVYEYLRKTKQSPLNLSDASLTQSDTTTTTTTAAGEVFLRDLNFRDLTTIDIDTITDRIINGSSILLLVGLIIYAATK